MIDLLIRRVTDPHDPALAAFGRLQEEVYYAPDMLIPPAAFPRLLAGGRGKREDRILVAEQGGEVVGGTIYSLLSGAAFNSFMGVARAAQGQGAGRALHAASLADVRAAGLPGMFADSVHVSRQSAAEREAEAHSGSDPVTRRQQLHALGLRTVDVPYWQPVGGEDGGPLKDLDLLYCPLEHLAKERLSFARAERVNFNEQDGEWSHAGRGSTHDVIRRTALGESETVPLALVTGTLEAYWRGWLGPQRAAAEARALAERAGNAERVRLLPGTETPGYWGS